MSTAFTGRIVMVVTNDAVSDPRVEKEATALAATGREVVLLAWDREGVAPILEERSGFRIERLGPRASYGGGLRSLTCFWGFWRRATERALELEPTVVHCHDLDTALIGLRVRRRNPGARLVIDHHELYRNTKMVPQHGMVGTAARTVVDLLDRRTASVADLVVVSVDAIRESEERWAPGRVVVIENAPDDTVFRPRLDPRPTRPFTIGYIGQKRYAASLKMLIDVVQRHDDLGALLAGGGTAAEEVDEIAFGLPRVEIVGRYTYTEQPALYERCDAVFGVYDSAVRNVQVAFPVKVMEAMACGLPVLVNEGTWVGDFVEREGIGIAVDGANPASVESALLRLKDEPGLAADMGTRGRALVEDHLSWRVVSARLLEAYP